MTLSAVLIVRVYVAEDMCERGYTVAANDGIAQAGDGGVQSANYGIAKRIAGC